MFRIHKLRLGFATNSSSSHSIVLLEEKVGDSITSSFSWEYFVLGSQEWKRMYFATSLKESFDYEEQEEEQDRVIDAVLRCYPALGNDLSFLDRHVDHASHIRCPRYHDNSMAVGFYRKITLPIIEAEDVVIFGGNDNDYREATDGYEGRVADYHYILDSLRDASWLIRDEDFGWILFNQRNGKRLTIEKEELDYVPS